jgi:uncharacterized protein YoxC
MILQILSDGSISPSWLFGSIITLLLLVLGYMLSRNLSRIETMIEKHEHQLNKQNTDIEVLKYSHSDSVRLSNQILDKLKAITPE